MSNREWLESLAILVLLFGMSTLFVLAAETIILHVVDTNYDIQRRVSDE